VRSGGDIALVEAMGWNGGCNGHKFDGLRHQLSLITASYRIVGMPQACKQYLSERVVTAGGTPFRQELYSGLALGGSQTTGANH
jgi:hypothetical protein